MEESSRSRNKKAKVDMPGTGGQVKEEIQDEANVGGAGAGAMVLVAADGGNPAGVSPIWLRFDSAMLHCPICTFALKPPIFQCDGGHLACSGCHGKLSGNKCYACDLGGSYGRNPVLEKFLRSGSVQCPHDAYGCSAFVAYCDVDDHRRECPCAPCCCPEHGCAFVGSPATLLGHISAEHRPVIVVRYGLEWKLTFTAAQRWHPLVGLEDRTVFLASCHGVSGPDGDTTAVSLVCVRANNGPAAPKYTCRLTLEDDGDDDDDDGGGLVMAQKVRSSALPGGTPVPDLRAFIALHKKALSGDGDSLVLSMRIDKVPSSGAAAAASPAAASTPVAQPPPRDRSASSRKQH